MTKNPVTENPVTNGPVTENPVMIPVMTPGMTLGMHVLTAVPFLLVDLPVLPLSYLVSPPPLSSSELFLLSILHAGILLLS